MFYQFYISVYIVYINIHFHVCFLDISLFICFFNHLISVIFIMWNCQNCVKTLFYFMPSRDQLRAHASTRFDVEAPIFPYDHDFFHYSSAILTIRTKPSSLLPLPIVPLLLS